MKTGIAVKKGTEIRDPGDPTRGYRITRDIVFGEYFKSDQLEPIGSVPTPKTDAAIPDFLGRAIQEICAK